MVRTPAELTMKRETRLSYGPVPRRLFADPLEEISWQIRGDEVLLRASGDHFVHYRRGAGITVERGPGADLSEESLWLNGSVYAAVASINGLVPIHASAIAHGDRVYAFTGSAGSGKSTLVTGLGARGFPLFCDDTLVLDLSDPQQIVCLPGHKRLKLAPDAIELTGAAPEERVSQTVDKWFARPPAGTVGRVLPLTELFFLEDSAEPTIAPVIGSDRFLRVQDDHYTAKLLAGARQFDRAAHFEHFSRLARNIRMLRFARPLDAGRFQDALGLLADHILNADDGA